MGFRISAAPASDDSICASDVFFIEEPVLDDAASAWLELRVIANNLIVGVPHLPHAADPDTAAALQRGLLRHVRQTRNNRSGTLVLHTYGDHLRR